MDLQQFLAVLRSQWKFITAVAVIGTLVCSALILSRAPTYASSGRVFIATPTAADADGFGTLLISQRTESYANLAKDPALLEQVAQRLDESVTAQQIDRRISAAVVPNTQVILITAQGATPEAAQQLAEAEVNELISLVAELEQPVGDEDAAVVARATAPPTLDPVPVSTPAGLALFLGFILSVLVGVIAALLRQRLDATVKSRAEVEAATGAAVISAIPFSPELQRDRAGSLRPDGPLTEAFRVLRSNLRFANIDSSRQMMLVTSAVANEGKTLTAVNLAQSLTAAGQSVLLIDFDMRNPSVASSLGLENSVGVLSVLLGRVSLDDAIQTDGSGLNVLATGPRPPNPSEILETDAVHNLLTSVRSDYDTILIDAPPLLPVADAASLVRHVDGVVLLTRYGRTRKESLQLAKERIVGLGGRLYGVVLNGVPKRSIGVYGYGYGYGYGDAYDTPRRSLTRSGARARSRADRN